MATTKKNKATKRKTSTAKKTNTASSASQSHSSNQNNASSQSRNSSSNNAYDFAAMSKNFANPSQFWNLSSLQNFQPANLQQMFEQMIETSQRNLEAVTACTQIAAERAKELMESQAEFASTMLQEAAATVQDTFNDKRTSPRTKLEGMNEYAKYCLEQTAKHARRTAEENMQVAQEISSKLSERMNECVEELRDAA